MKQLLKKIIPSSAIDALWHFPRAVLATLWYGSPARRLTCIAIAGTKGKTSTAYFLHDILQQTGSDTALFSTAGGKIKNEVFLNTWKMTTPSPFSLQRFLARAVRNGCTHAVIEVSSHALKQHRVWGIPFTVALITNLSPDHLEYHKTADEYIHIHELLPSAHTKTILINADDSHSDFFKKDPRTISFSSTEQCVSCIATLPQWWASFQKPNLTAVCAAARALGRKEDAICSALATLCEPPGRFEEIKAGQPFRVIVDYAHSPESLRFFFTSVRPLVSGNLIVVYGACGDRDATQRPLMGAVLQQFADTIILTSDDPYSEDPADIARQVQTGITDTMKSPIMILDRKEAIRRALEIAQENDCVCILGKGAEQLQIFKDKKIPWDDRKIVRGLLTRAQM
ncbi:MAG: UDP-N-acetylmuramoyl-L-alanyl-D-glutamate--2,6-diaminopimelate ligase [Candidatus Uhrbacteria bacterium]|nr:UDP-N-acetylmuramoyl-L-alanyl-D-glutamate--2,6-diaminopimelate ligase [Candidatus Uhrbacteria bacterium]